VGQNNSLTEPFNLGIRPKHFIERPETTNSLKSRLLEKSNNDFGKLNATVIFGIPGSGKSAIAKNLACDFDIRKHFSKILITTLGQKPELLTKITDWIKYLDKDSPHFSNLQSASNHLSNLLKNKTALLIVDDAWEIEDVEPFLVPRETCQILITTRNEDIANDSRIKEMPCEIGVMTESQALELIKQLLQRNWHLGEEYLAKKVAKKVGYLPLALEIIAELIVENTAAWEDLESDLETEIAKLEEIAVEKRSLVASINLSLKTLSNHHLEAFAWLGVLPEDITITDKICSTIWDTDERNARKTLSFLRKRALLSEFEELGTVSYQMHDTLHDAARNLLCNPPNPKHQNQLAGLGINFSQAQSILLERYKKKCNSAQECLWVSLPDDGYIHSHLSWHMQKAGQIEEIHKLLNSSTKTGKNTWYQARENLGQIAGYKEDIERAWQLARQANEHNIKCNQSIDIKNLNFEIRYALILSSLCTLSYNIPPELLAALVKAKIKSVPYALAMMQHNLNDQRKMQALLALQPYLKPYWQEAFKIAQETKEIYCKAQAVAIIAPFVTEKEKNLYPILRNILNETHQIFWDNNRIAATGNIAKHLPENEAQPIFDKLLQEAEKYLISDSTDNINEILLISNFTDSLERKKQLIQAALKKAWAMDIDEQSWYPILFRNVTEVLSYLPESQWQEEIEKLYILAFGTFTDTEVERAHALIRIIPYLPEHLIKDIKKKLNDKFPEVYISLSCRFAKLGYKDEALNIINLIDSAYSKLIAFSEIAPNLSKDSDYVIFADILEKIESVLSNNDFLTKYNIISNIALYLPEKLLEKALKIAEKINDSSSQENFICSSSLYLANLGDLEAALNLLSKISDSLLSIKTSAKLLSYMDKNNQEKISKELLQNLLETSLEWWQLETVAEIIPYLYEPYKTSVLQCLMAGINKVEDFKPEQWYELEINEILSNISLQLAKQGYSKECVYIIQLMKDDETREDTIESTIRKAVNFLGVEELKELSKLAMYLGFYRNRALQVLACRFLKLNNIEEALKHIILMLDCLLKVPRYYIRVEVLSEVAEYLVKNNQKDKLNLLIEKALENNIRFKHLLVAKLATYFEEKEKIILSQQALEIFQQTLNKAATNTEKLDLLISMLPFLSAKDRDKSLKKCRNIIGKIKGNVKNHFKKHEFIDQLIESLIESNCFEQALEALENITDIQSRTESLQRFFPYANSLPEQYKTQIITKGKSIIENVYFKEWLEGKVFSSKNNQFINNFLEFLIKTSNTQDALLLIKKIQKESLQVEQIKEVFPIASLELKNQLLNLINSSELKQQYLLLLDLASYFPIPLDPTTLLKITKSVVKETRHEHNRINQFSKLVKKLVELPIDLLYQAWQLILQELTQEKREDFLKILEMSFPIIEKLGGAEFINETALSVDQVGNWWE